jgi:phage-related holin
MKAFVLKLLIATVAIFAPLESYMLGIGGLIIIDLILGIVAARKKGYKFESKKLKHTGVKMLVYNLLLISSFIAETVLAPHIPMIKIALSFLVLIEITSISESFEAITGSSFIKYVKKFISDKLNPTEKENK